MSAADGRTRPRRGSELELRIDSLAQGGRGVARTEGGFVVFVAGALPGDRVRARVGKSKKTWAEAAISDLLEPGPERIGDRCIHGGEPCPGAAWQGLPYSRQLEEKQKQVAEALERLGSFSGIDLEPIVPAVAEWRYRNKLEYSFGNPGPEDPPGDPVLGFHARGHWDRIVDVDDCLLASEANNGARNLVREWARDEGLNAVDAAGAGELRNLIVREGRRTGQIQTRLVTAAAEIPRPPVDLHTVIEGPSGGTGGPTGVLGEEFLGERLGDLDLRVSPGAFLQTNTETAERLYSVAREFAALAGDERLFDLYCGIGTIGLGMAADAGEVWGIENVSEAIVDAEANAERNGIGNARFRVADARLGIRPLVEEAGRPDVVVIDPPRAGLSAKIVRRVLECEADRIVYVSCNPTTMAPNARQMVDAGYRLTRVRPVDMFPQTPHIECVALLERVSG
ncbi:MAG: 23S rRNA (uracil(1939)-C(5))-methyltransferase RlmD [Solirubrobacterales bacterium]|nr:23S rRNA (uracil(1939)-C(5))-methyltransferase RlmD [Solirubrobacterales bacterium]